MNLVRRALLDMSAPLAPVQLVAAPKVETANWDALRTLARGFGGEPGMVMHLGDSITRDPAYAAYALRGVGKAHDEAAICQWMHAGESSPRDGWFLATGEHNFPRSACNGITAGESLAGVRSGIKVEELIQRYRPQAAIIMFGTNEATRLTQPDQRRSHLEKILVLLLAAHCVPVLSTIPPHYRRRKLVDLYNDSIRSLCAEFKIPMIDFYSEIASRRPRDWNGTLMEGNDVHPAPGPCPAGPATEANLRNSGYLLRGWLSLRKMIEIKREVFDHLGA